MEVAKAEIPRPRAHMTPARNATTRHPSSAMSGPRSSVDMLKMKALRLKSQATLVEDVPRFSRSLEKMMPKQGPRRSTRNWRKKGMQAYS